MIKIYGDDIIERRVRISKREEKYTPEWGFQITQVKMPTTAEENIPLMPTAIEL